MTVAPVHPRFRWAVEALGVQASDHVLEVGCGPGVAAGLVAQRITSGHVTAIDRSEVAATRASGAISAHIAEGRATVHRMSLRQLGGDADQHARFDVVFAVNVNLFWVDPTSTEPALVRRLLRPGGTCVLFYDAHDPSMATRAWARAADTLRGLGFATERVPGPAPSLVGLRARIEAPVASA